LLNEYVLAGRLYSDFWVQLSLLSFTSHPCTDEGKVWRGRVDQKSA